MWPYSWTHLGTPSHLGHMDRLAATMPSQAHAGAAQEAPNIGQWEEQDVPLVRPSSCIVKGGIPSSRRYLPTYLWGRWRLTAILAASFLRLVVLGMMWWAAHSSWGVSFAMSSLSGGWSGFDGGSFSWHFTCGATLVWIRYCRLQASGAPT